jgi:hypothetical protein
MENVPHASQSMDSDPEVQEIDPPVLTRSGRKRYHRKKLRHPIDPRFCRHSTRNKNNNQQTADTLDAIVVPHTSANTKLSPIQDSANTIR